MYIALHVYTLYKFLKPSRENMLDFLTANMHRTLVLCHSANTVAFFILFYENIC